MTVLPSMGLTLPTRGPSGAGLWGDTDDANLGLLDVHDHSTGKGVKITPSGLNINADLPFSALYAPTQLHRVQFSAIAGAALTGAQRKSLFVSDGTGGMVANELYYLTNAGASVQITNGSALNVGSFAGTIGGDYAGVGAQLNYTDSSKTYDFKESTADSHGWARLQCGGIRLIEFNTTETFFVAHIAPSALAASYTATWPTALPGSQTLAQIDATGQIIFSNTLASAQDIKHGTRTLQLAASAFQPATNAIVWSVTNGHISFGEPTKDVLFAPIPLKDGDRILAVRVYCSDSNVGPSTLTASFYSTSSTGTGTDVGSATSAGTGANQTLTIGSLTTTVTASTAYGIKIRETSAGGSSCSVFMAEVDFDRP